MFLQLTSATAVVYVHIFSYLPQTYKKQPPVIKFLISYEQYKPKRPLVSSEIIPSYNFPVIWIPDWLVFSSHTLIHA